MNRQELKAALGEAFAVPPPEGKRAFLRALPPAPVSHLRFLLDQTGYIRPAVWAVSLGVFVLGLTAGQLVPADGLWVTAALTPFAALAAAAEGSRSAFHGMEELELASRFGLKSTFLARMGALGLVHLVLLAALAAIGGGGFFRTGAYFLTPYLLTDLLCLAALRRIRGKEGLYVCGVIAVLVAGLAAAGDHRVLYGPKSFRWWLAALAVIAALTGREYCKKVKIMEELSWS